MTNYVKFYVDKSVESPLGRICHERGESVTHVISASVVNLRKRSMTRDTRMSPELFIGICVV